MPARRWIITLTAVAALGFALAACGGGSKKDTKNTATSGTPASSSSTPAAGKTASGTTKGNSDDAKALNSVAQKFASSTFKAEYNLSSTGSDQPVDGKMTMTKKGSDKFRFDVTSTQDGQPVALTLIETKDNSVFCLQDAGELAPILGVDQGKGVCFKNDPTNGVGGIDDITSTFKNLATSDVTVTGKSSRTIAGQNAQCYNYSTASTGETNETCFSNDGVPLYDKTVSGSDTTTLEATKLDSGVQDSDFDIPYEVKDFPNIADATP
jgi:hypothetical protein